VQRNGAPGMVASPIALTELMWTNRRTPVLAAARAKADAAAASSPPAEYRTR